MLDYTVRCLLLLLPTLIAGSMVLFFSMRLLPQQDAIDLQVGEARTQDPDAADKLRAQLGLSGSLFSQYLDWATGFATGDWGKSLHTRRPISEELLRRVPVSFERSLIGLIITWLVSFPLGIVSAVYQD